MEWEKSRNIADAGQKGEVGAHKFRGEVCLKEGLALGMDCPHGCHRLRKIVRAEVR